MVLFSDVCQVGIFGIGVLGIFVEYIVWLFSCIGLLVYVMNCMGFSFVE